MRKNITYSISSFIIILSLMLGYVAYAKDTTNGNKIGEEKKVELQNTIKELKGEVKDTIQSIIKTTQDNRNQFKIEIKANKEKAEEKISKVRANFNENLSNIKNEVKKTATENILNKIQELNVKMTDNFSNKIDQIENILVSIESRIIKAESKGLDVTNVRVEVEKSKVVIESIRKAISTQAGKVYEVNITNETLLKTEMTNLRNSFSKDIKAINILMKSAHESIRNINTTLAQIPNIDNDEEEIKTEDTINNNQ